MGGDSSRDRWLASAACLVIAAILFVVTVWAVHGVSAAEQDVDRFGRTLTGRGAGDAAGFGLMMMAIGGTSALAGVALVGLAVWIPMAGRGRSRRRATRARRSVS